MASLNTIRLATLKKGTMNKDFYRWLAGFIDGDGCFNISLHGNEGQLHVGFCVTIAVKELDSKVIKYVHTNAKLGRLYFRNKGTDTGLAVWQTTNLADSIEITRRVLPYLVLKQKRAKIFLKLATWYLSTCRAINGLRKKASRVRTASQMHRLVKAAISLNDGMQVKRHQRSKKLAFWNKFIARYYK